MMTESSSSSSTTPKPLQPSTLNLSATKLVNFTSCNNSNVPSMATKTAGEIQSNFGSITPTSDTTIVDNESSYEVDFQRRHPPLGRDLRRVDLDSSYCDSLAFKCKPLERTESISLPSTPIEQISTLMDIQCQTDMSAQNTTTSNEQDGEIYNDLYNSDTQQSDAGESISKSESTLRSVSSTSSTESNIPNFYGVNWSENALPTSHCWFPFTPSDPSSCQPCSYLSCKNPKPSLLLSVVQCESCLIVVHTHHLVDIQTPVTTTMANYMPPCRPSFCEPTDLNDAEKLDQHFWINISVLNKPCVLCKRKSIASSLFGNNRTTAMPIFDLINPNSNYRSPIPGSQTPAASGTALQCLWCSRAFHRRCWEQTSHQDDRNVCDYGVFRQIIVRPQWIHRDPGSRTGFRAHYPTNVDYQSYCTPLLLFINKRSGGQSGEKIYRKLLRLLNPRQVFLLENDQTIINALEIYASLENTRICVFGGDGTVGWVLGRLAESFPSLNNPPVCICPLGTGNDLSRVLSWGEQYDPKRLLPTLTQIPYAQPIALDRWQVIVEPFDSQSLESHANSAHKSTTPRPADPKFIRDTKRASFQNHRTLPNNRFINYMSFGLDAAIALEFHDRRSRDPSKFSSPLKNKLMYLNESRKYLNDFARSRMWSLSSYIRLICDGEDLTHLIQNCHTLLVLNIPGYASGTNPWGKSSNSSSSQQSSIQKDSDSFEQISTSSVDLVDYPANTHEVYELITLNECSNDQQLSMVRTNNSAIQSSRFERQDFGDKKIEVVGLSTTHMATIHIGFRGIRLAQCNQIRIEICCPMTAQMDGEPFYLPESVVVNVIHAGQVLVLKNEN